MATAARQRPGVFSVDENAALAELERAWTGCPHCSRPRQAYAWRPYLGSMYQAAATRTQLVRLSQLARQLVTRPAAGRADL